MHKTTYPTSLDEIVDYIAKNYKSIKKDDKSDKDDVIAKLKLKIDQQSTNLKRLQSLQIIENKCSIVENLFAGYIVFCDVFCHYFGNKAMIIVSVVYMILVFTLIWFRPKNIYFTWIMIEVVDLINVLVNVFILSSPRNSIVIIGIDCVTQIYRLWSNMQIEKENVKKKDNLIKKNKRIYLSKATIVLNCIILFVIFISFSYRYGSLQSFTLFEQ